MAAVVGRSRSEVGRNRRRRRQIEAWQFSRPGRTHRDCKTFLSSFKVPKKIDFRDQMPMSSFGKILRRDVRKSYWEQQEVKV
jgi:Acyl-CoA synthetases (AMP-forming)/AMP-acid ligases II